MRYLTEDIKHKALELDFDLVGVTGAWPIDTRQVELFNAWLKSGFAGQMDYMYRNFEKRINPAMLLEGAKSVIVAGVAFKPPVKKPPGTTTRTGRIADYALYEDYHPFMKDRLHRLTDFIASAAGSNHKFKVCVDSAPIAERALAVRAGLGFIGKNHILINPVLGPQIFLGEIITTVQLQPDQPITGNCADCTECICACPSGALRADGQFDANRCISYLTIEYKGQVPENLAEIIGDRLFGCDECVYACPYHQRAPLCRYRQIKFDSDRAVLSLDWILEMTQQEFNAQFADSVIGRIELERLKRNARICLVCV